MAQRQRKQGQTGNGQPMEPVRNETGRTRRSARGRSSDGTVTSLIPPALLVTLTILVFAASCRYSFVGWDDPLNISKDPHLNGTAPVDIGYFWTHSFLHVYRPIIYSFWGLVATIAILPSPVTETAIGTYRVDPHVFHAAGLMLHLLNVSLVYLLLVRLVRKPWAACAGAAVFAVHPLQVESVVWITGANATLHGLFALSTIWCWIKFVDSENGKAGRRRWGWYGAATATFILALFTYPMAVAIPLLVWCIDRWALGQPIRRTLPAVAPWFVLSVVWILVTATARNIGLVAIHSPVPLRPFVAGDALAFNLEKLVLPWALAPDYGRTPTFVTQTHHWAFYTWLVPAAIAFAVWRVRKSEPQIVLGALIFGAALLPVLGLVTNAFEMYSTVSDRYAYLALFGVAIVVASLLSRVTGATAIRGAVAACSVVLVCLSVLTVRHATDYRDWQTLYRHTIAVNPRSWVSYYNLGVDLQKTGHIDEAITCYRRAIAARPDYDEAYNNLGAALATESHYDEAAVEMARAIEIAPREPRWRFGLGELELQTGHPADAVGQLTACLGIAPHFSGGADQLVLAYNLQGASLVQQHRLDEAVGNWRQALVVEPNNVTVHDNLGAVYLMQHRPVDAAAEFQSALAIAPGDPTARAGLAQSHV
ncbi:MAG: tetratricopeptide repeat protein [Capsulimonadaceae bacterium]